MFDVINNIRVSYVTNLFITICITTFVVIEFVEIVNKCMQKIDP